MVLSAVLRRAALCTSPSLQCFSTGYTPQMYIIDTTLRASGAFMLVLVGVIFLWRSRRRLTGVISGLLAFSIAAHFLCPIVVQRLGMAPATLPLLMACAAVPAVFWFFAQALFKDGFRLRAWHAAPVAALLIAALVDLHLALSSVPASSVARLVTAVTAKLLALAFIVSALVQVYAGRNSDLLEARRTMRSVVVATGGAYMVVVVAVELYLRGADAPPPLSVLDASVTIVLALAVSAAIWRLRDSAFGDVPQPTDHALDPLDRSIVERLMRAMEVERVYRREGLTIAGLADALQVQEYRLRRVINQHLGFRNFNDFLNQRRIREACEALSDPARSRIPVLTIALDLGYRSLSPFNRAFKEHTSLTPSQYRRAKLSAPPPADSAEAC